MPTNVSPEYKKAEAAYRKARDPAERLALLKEMLSTIPKHKGTEHLQADIKSRIKDLTQELAGPKKGGARTGPVYSLRTEGAAQVALLGPPSSGKSSLHVQLTGSQAEIGPFPHTTQAPLPGMLPYEDVYFQLIDLPPVSTTYMESWLPNALQPAQAALLVVDFADPDCVEHVLALRDRLDQKRITLTDNWGGRLGAGYLEQVPQPPLPRHAPAVQQGPADSEQDGQPLEAMEDPFRVFLPVLLLASKCDLNKDPEEIAVFSELVGANYPAIFVSAITGEGLGHIGPLLFRGLGIIRIYTKVPGRPPDMKRPFTLTEGETVLDVARLIHRELATSIRFARIWGSGKFEGQQVGRDHIVADGDVLELHA
jgi:ribosome-interacting GTPase 1